VNLLREKLDRAKIEYMFDIIEGWGHDDLLQFKDKTRVFRILDRDLCLIFFFFFFFFF